eukprot:Skav215084  [mRNA]  locus=scaffold1068:27899:29092:+ [translate_table: standard]
MPNCDQENHDLIIVSQSQGISLANDDWQNASGHSSCTLLCLDTYVGELSQVPIENPRIAIDLEIVSWPTARHLKHRLLEAQGYRMVNLQYWDWRRARTEEDQNLFLEREGLRPDLRSVNLALRAASWGAALQLLRRLTVTS